MRGFLNLKMSKPQLEHLYDRARVRELTLEDIQAFQSWVAGERDYPENGWYKDFGSFKAVGHGLQLNSFLTENQSCVGIKISKIVEDWLQ